MRKKLTDVYLKTVTAPEGKRLEVFDEVVPGFGVRVGGAGKSFFLVRRVGSIKHRFSIGRYIDPRKLRDGASLASEDSSVPFLTLEQARSEANRLIHEIKIGKDPREPARRRKAERKVVRATTFDGVTATFLRDYVKPNLRPRTEEGFRWAFNSPVVSKWRDRPIRDITTEEIGEAIGAYRVAGKLTAARLLRSYLSSFFNWASSNEYGQAFVKISPVPPAARRTRRKTAAEATRATELRLQPADVRAIVGAAQGLRQPFRAWVTVLALTGQRRSETALTKWADLDLEGPAPMWRLPGSNTKNGQPHEVPLSPELVAVFEGLPRIGEPAFSTDGVTSIADFSKVKADLDRILKGQGITLGRWTWHDFRKAFATGLGEMGFSAEVIELALNHKSGVRAGIVSTYNKSRLMSERRRAVEAWSRFVMGEEPAANVVPLTARIDRP